MNPAGPIFAVVPVKAPSLGKTRLAPLLDDLQRKDLCVALARRAIESCAEAFGPDHTIVVTDAPEIRDIAAAAGAHAIREPFASGLNPAVCAGSAHARRLGAATVLVVPADLALVSAGELRRAAEMLPRAPGVVLVPDRRNSGTNLLGATPPRDDLIDFGADSLERHSTLAVKAGYAVQVHRSEALGLDLDFPEDYLFWRSLLEPAGTL
jgi:2-phospho-L-lactate/phosphoenolpyruvate guanylyltransferase